MDLNFEELENKKVDVELLDYLKIVSDCCIDLSEEMPLPEILLSIGEHKYKNKYYPTPVMTSGEMSAIVAVSKAKKSFLKSAFIGSYIGGRANVLFGNMKSHRDKDYTILDFDTEQGKYYAQRTFRRVQDITEGQYDNYHCYATRQLSSVQRLELIDYCLKNQKTLYKEPVKLLSIDGIADLVENTNDIVMSKEASDYIMKWTYEYNIHCMTIIHKSGMTGKPLGHLGTYVLKKAESVIDLEVQDDKTILVSNPYSRGYQFDSFSFDVNGDSLPYLIEDNF
jgi:hypothetical protein